MALHQAGQIDDAERLYRELLTHTPEHATARHYLGVCHYQRGQLPEAAIEISRALRSNPAEPMALNNLGLVYKAQGDNAAAGQCFTHAIEQDPHSAVALTNRGLLLLESGRTEEAIRDCAAAAEYAPTLAETHNNLAKALVAVRRIVEAEAAWARAVAANPDLAEAHFNRAEVLVELRRFEAAIESYRCAEALNPAMPWLAGGLMHAQMHACDWTDFASHEAKILAAVDRGDKAIKPLPLIALRSTMAQQQRCARAIISEKFAGHHRRPVIANHRHDRLRIAYLSADFRTHPTSQLIAGLIEHHDRARFEVLGVYVGPPQQDEWRARMERAFDRFFDFHGNSDEAIATALQSLEIDILIDLMGHTHMARHGVLAARIAPVQTNYLGYPGTAGAPFVDYIIADPVLIEPDDRDYYDEKIVTLPYTYQPNDDKRALPGAPGSRTDHGLPAEGFVFCCFNNSFKITPVEFDIWMRLLQQIEGSVLWLLQPTEVAERNLRREAAARGVDASRLCFAPRLSSLATHFGRHRHADLFLDTFNYNAHTTASDALWSGLPVLTCRGDTFASRVAASLLGAIGLPELVTTSIAAYEARARELATDATQLRGIRDKLHRHRDSHPLFDIARFTRHIESAYVAMHQRAVAGLAPDHIAVTA